MNTKANSDSMCRGLRNNNPLNIRRTKGCRWKGQCPEQTDPAFVQFTALEWGIRAACCLLRTYERKYGLRTVEDIVSRWAPPTENNTSAYIRHVCRTTGFQPSQPLAPLHWPQLLQAMAQMETGRLLPLEVIERGIKLFNEN